ncbi:MAG TPA: response regulator [Chitinophagaceae bacterium]|jgi:CheY-like chemotaxis protein|nr:response regulator [Chitinophagaceae bacterium]
MKPIRHILFADDDADDSEFFTLVLGQIDPKVTVSVATSREELFSSLDQSVPDLLFLDSFLQNDSGIASIEELRRNERYAGIPVVMYTGSSDMNNIRSAFRAGAHVYVVKPSTTREIKQVLESLLQRNWAESSPRPQFYLQDRFQEYRE